MSERQCRHASAAVSMRTTPSLPQYTFTHGKRCAEFRIRRYDNGYCCSLLPAPSAIRREYNASARRRAAQRAQRRAARDARASSEDQTRVVIRPAVRLLTPSRAPQVAVVVCGRCVRRYGTAPVTTQHTGCRYACAQQSQVTSGVPTYQFKTIKWRGI